MTKQKVFFCIDLGASKPEVMELSGKPLEDELKLSGTSNPLNASDYDRKIFLREKTAERYLNRFLTARKKLRRLKDGGWPPGPSLIYKRHYLVQTTLGEKLQTYRSYRRDWKRGQVIKLYDQTYFVLVKLISITKTSDGYRYDFSLLKRK